MPFAAFGPGILIATRTDITTPLAINVGYVQEFNIDVDPETKHLYGQKQFPLVAARGTIKATGKFKAAMISGIAWNAMVYGMSAFSTANSAWVIDSTFTVGASSTAPTAVSTATWNTDLGVWYSTKGLPLQRVASGSEAAGKYSVAAGIYTFVTADAGLAVKITYTADSSTGQKLAITNQLIGVTPTFQLDYYTALNQPTAKAFAVRLYQCINGKQGIPFKLEDFMIPEFEFDFFADSQDRVFDMYLPEIS